MAKLKNIFKHSLFQPFIMSDTSYSSDFHISKCKTRKGWSAKPVRNIRLNLNNIKKRFKVILDGEVLLVLDYEGEIIVHGYGELVFKDLNDKERIAQIAKEIYKAGK